MQIETAVLLLLQSPTVGSSPPVDIYVHYDDDSFVFYDDDVTKVEYEI